MEIPELGKIQITEKHIKKYYFEFYQYILNNYPQNLSWVEKLYWYKYGLKDTKRCKVCGNKTKFINFTQGYREYCSLKCSNSDIEKIKKQQNATLKHYGVLNPSQNAQIRDKVKQTCLERYGVEHVSQSNIIKDKAKQTCLERYGVEHASQSNIIKDKAKQTCLERYGVEHYTNREKSVVTCQEKYGVNTPFSISSIRTKSKQTKLERYGDENYNNIEKNKTTKLERYGDENYNNIEKSKTTKLERYGDENYNNIEKSKTTKLERYGDENYNNKEKSRITCLEKYGVQFPMQNSSVADKSLKIRKQHILENTPELIKYTEDGLWVCKCPHLECNKCAEKFFITRRNIFYDRKRFNIETCTRLLEIKDGRNTGTEIELFVRNILDDYNIKYICNSKKILDNGEIDIFIPGKNIAIECNGVYWHSTRMKEDIKYHSKKYHECESKGIQLLTMWEDQIKNKPDIVQSILLSKLGIYKERIYARKCTIKEIDSKTCKLFLDHNHIQGQLNASIKIGLFYLNELVAVMTFSKCRSLMGSKTAAYELSRFCTKLNTQVVGGASRLFKYVLNKYNLDEIFSFSSNDISNGSLYKNLNFKYAHENLCYFYIDQKDLSRHHRTEFTRSQIIKKGLINENSLNENSNWTEASITTSLGLYKIYDSGQLKWVYCTNNVN